MSILLYIPQPLPIAEKLLAEINTLALGETVEVHRTIDELSGRLHGSVHDLVTAILIIPNRQTLIEILSLREWLQDLRIILILPDRDSDIVSMGHSLFPRFVSYLDSDFAEIEIPAVLNKMFNLFAETKRKTNSQRDGPIAC